MTDWRALCEELANHLQVRVSKEDSEIPMRCFYSQAQQLIDRARAALAQPEPEVVGPSDEEVDVWADQQGFIRGHGDHPCGFWIDDGDAGAFARAALARWGRPAPVPAGEVAELVRWLRSTGEGMPCLSNVGYARLTRTADLLEHLYRSVLADRVEDALAQPAELPSDYIDPEHTGKDREMLDVFYTACQSEGGTSDEIHLRGLRAVLDRFGNYPVIPDSSEPVAWMYQGEPDFDGNKWRENLLVTLDRKLAEHGAKPDKPVPLFCVGAAPVALSERLPEPEDCDAQGRCWGFHPYNPEDDNVWTSWSLVSAKLLPSTSTWIGWDYWLPAHALPVPGEKIPTKPEFPPPQIIQEGFL